MKAATLTSAKLQHNALKMKSDHIEEVRQLKAAHEHSTADTDNQITMLGRELNVLETRYVGSATTHTAMTWCALKGVGMFSAAGAQTEKPDTTRTAICVCVASIALVAQIVYIPKYSSNSSVSK